MQAPLGLRVGLAVLLPAAYALREGLERRVGGYAVGHLLPGELPALWLKHVGEEGGTCQLGGSGVEFSFERHRF